MTKTPYFDAYEDGYAAGFEAGSQTKAGEGQSRGVPDETWEGVLFDEPDPYGNINISHKFQEDIYSVLDLNEKDTYRVEFYKIPDDGTGEGK